MKNDRNTKLVEMQRYLEELKEKASKMEEEKKISLEEQEKNKQEHKLLLMKRLEELKGRVLKQQEEKNKINSLDDLKEAQEEKTEEFVIQKPKEKTEEVLLSNKIIENSLVVEESKTPEEEIAEKIIEVKKTMIDIYSKEDEVKFLLETDVNVKNDFKSLINVIKYISRFDEELNKEFNDQKYVDSNSKEETSENVFSAEYLDELITKKMTELFEQNGEMSEEEKINSAKIESDLEEISMLILK